MCKIFPGFKKKALTSPSVEMLSWMVGTSPLKQSFFAVKLGEKRSLSESQFGGPIWHQVSVL